MFKRREFIRALAVILVAALVPFAAAGSLPPCQIGPPVDRVYDLPLDDSQSTVRWVHAESELWICHGADGCLWMPLQDSECKRRRMEK